MGGGSIIINQNAAVKEAVNTQSVIGVLHNLPVGCFGRVKEINDKALSEWTEFDYAYMVSMLIVARHG